MEDILASIKKVIAEEKDLRAAVPSEVDEASDDHGDDDDILELDEPVEAFEETSEADLGPPLVDEEVADDSRAKLAELVDVATTAQQQGTATSPLEQMLRDMLRPVLKQWLDENLPRIVDEHVKREISRITGKPL